MEKAHLLKMKKKKVQRVAIIIWSLNIEYCYDNMVLITQIVMYMKTFN